MPRASSVVSSSAERHAELDEQWRHRALQASVEIHTMWNGVFGRKLPGSAGSRLIRHLQDAALDQAAQKGVEALSEARGLSLQGLFDLGLDLVHRSEPVTEAIGIKAGGRHQVHLIGTGVVDEKPLFLLPYRAPGSRLKNAL